MATPRKGKRPRKRASAYWRETFLAALSETSNVTKAADKANVDTSKVYKERRASAEFNRRWQEALAEGYDNLELDLLHRLRTGHLEGGKAQARRKYDNAIAFRLLTAHRDTVSRQRAIRNSGSIASAWSKSLCAALASHRLDQPATNCAAAQRIRLVRSQRQIILSRLAARPWPATLSFCRPGLRRCT